MTRPISAATALAIARAHEEVRVAEALLAEITEALSRRTAPDIRDAFGRHQNGLQLGVPHGDNGHRLFNVPWSICRPVIELHIAHQRAQIDTLTLKALQEAAGERDAAAETDPS